MSKDEIFEQLMEMGGEKLSDSGICLDVKNYGCFYFRLHQYFSSIHCLIGTEHPTQGIRVFDDVQYSKINSLKDLFSNFRRTESIISNFDIS